MKNLKHQFYGTVEEGKIQFFPGEKEQLNLWLGGLEGKEIELSVGKKQYNRTGSQNNYYWGVVVEMLAEEFGWSTDDMHEFLKKEFNAKIVSQNEKEYAIPQSTATLSAEEFVKYLDRCVQFAAENNVIIPEPNQINLDE